MSIVWKKGDTQNLIEDLKACRCNDIIKADIKVTIRGKIDGV